MDTPPQLSSRRNSVKFEKSQKNYLLSLSSIKSNLKVIYFHVKKIQKIRFSKTFFIRKKKSEILFAKKVVVCVFFCGGGGGNCVDIKVKLCWFFNC